MRYAAQTPAQLDSDTTNLADTWIKMDARIRVIHGFGNERQDEATKVELFLYLIGGQGREIYDTMAFEVPTSERTLV